MTRRTVPRAPAALGAAGRATWRAVHLALDPALELDERDIAVLTIACGQADTVATLEEAIARDGATVTGAAGQPRLNAAVTELRQSRVALSHLLCGLDLSEPVGAASASSKRASKAAKVRWAAEARKTARVEARRRDA